MGGRANREQQYNDREAWVMEVSTERLTAYEKMLTTPDAGIRLDGTSRIAEGDYFRDLIKRERERRTTALF